MVGRSDQSGVDIIVPPTQLSGRQKRNKQRSLITYKEDGEGNTDYIITMVTTYMCFAIL